MRHRLIGAVSAWMLAAGAHADAFPERQSIQQKEFSIEFSPGDEAYARALVSQLPVAPPEQPSAPALPLRVTDLRARRDDILKLLSAHLALSAPSVKMTQIFDNFTTTFVGLQSRSLMPRITRFALWRKPELLARLRAGQQIPGFSLASDGGIQVSLGVSFEFDEHSDPDASITRGLEELSRLTWPIKIGEETGMTPDAEIRQRLDEVRANAAGIASFQSTELQRLGVVTVLHETVESTLVDRYIRSPDRRWFCEGVANFVAFQTLATLLGADVARAYYDVNAELAKFAALRERVDLEHWPVKEDPKSGGVPEEVNTASYAFATDAVFKAFGGDPKLLPQVLATVGKTPLEKVTMQTVRSAYRTQTGKELLAKSPP